MLVGMVHYDAELLFTTYFKENTDIKQVLHCVAFYNIITS